MFENNITDAEASKAMSNLILGRIFADYIVQHYSREGALGMLDFCQAMLASSLMRHLQDHDKEADSEAIEASVEKAANMWKDVVTATFDAREHGVNAADIFKQS